MQIRVTNIFYFIIIERGYKMISLCIHLDQLYFKKSTSLKIDFFCTYEIFFIRVRFLSSFLMFDVLKSMNSREIFCICTIYLCGRSSRILVTYYVAIANRNNQTTIRKGKKEDGKSPRHLTNIEYILNIFIIYTHTSK